MYGDFANLDITDYTTGLSVKVGDGVITQDDFTNLPGDENIPGSDPKPTAVGEEMYKVGEAPDFGSGPIMGALS